MRNLLATVPHGVREAIAAVVRTIFAQPDHASAMTQLRKVADDLIQRIRSPTRPVRFNLNQKLAEWENFYNYQRPQGAFEEKTPYEALREKLG